MRYFKYLLPVIPLLMILGLVEVLADLKMFRPYKLRVISNTRPSETLPEIQERKVVKIAATPKIQVPVVTAPVSVPVKASTPALAAKTLTVTKGPFNPTETYNLRVYAAFNTGSTNGLNSFMDQSSISGTMTVEKGKISQFDVSLGSDATNTTINFNDVEINNNLSYIQDPDGDVEGAGAQKANSTLLYTGAQDGKFSIFTVSFIAGKYNGIKLQFVKDKDFIAFDEMVRERNDRFKEQGPALLKIGKNMIKSPIRPIDQNIEDEGNSEPHEHVENQDLSNRLRNLSSRPVTPEQKAAVENDGVAF